MSRALLTALTFCTVLVLTACGGDSKTAKPAVAGVGMTDAQRAANLPLRTSDLPMGFAAVDAKLSSPAPILNPCVGDLAWAAALQPGETFLRDRDQIASQSLVFATPAEATQALTGIASETGQTCLSGLVQSQLENELRNKAIVGTVLKTSFSTLDPATALFRATAVKRDNSSTQTVATVDALISESDRSITAVWLTWFGGSPDEATEKSIVTALRARASTVFG